MKSVVIAAATAFVCVLGLQAASAATAPSQNVKDAGLTHPYQESNSSNCGTSDCETTFGTIAAPETVVQHVSCSFAVPTGAVVWSTTLFEGNSSANANFLPASSSAPTGGYNYYIINETTQLFLTTGDKPFIDIGTMGGNVDVLTCTISGYHS
jgi:hypothetical protein